jgi:anthranilate synthase
MAFSDNANGSSYSYLTPSGILIRRIDRELDFVRGVDFLVGQLDRKRGCYLSSGVEDQDRYARFDFGFTDPPLELIALGREVHLRALNPRGVPILAMLKSVVREHEALSVIRDRERELVLAVAESESSFPEEERSRQPSAFTPIRALMQDFIGFEDRFLGLYGAFGYDLIFQFDPMSLNQPRGDEDKLYHLYLPDRILVCDRRLQSAHAFEFEFSRRDLTTEGLSDDAFERLEPDYAAAGVSGEITSDHTPEEYMEKVEYARERMRAGDIFEVVLSRKYSAGYEGPPSTIYDMMRRINPSPYEFFFQFGDDQLIGASPEMFVRVDGDRVESSPISGTVRRGDNAMEDAEKIKQLYDSEKDEVELTMCTDVDRNDKARICRPGTVKLLSRRMIERYAGLFHTVDHVEGRLRDGFDGLDAFLSHMWAVTLTGAPKRMAVSIIEEQEASARRWYGGAIGALMFNGTVNTGITIRTVHLEDGRADYRAGATLVYDSVPREEELETEVKATAFFRAMAELGDPVPAAPRAAGNDVAPEAGAFAGKRLVMVDNEDSFVHTLADYFRQTGAAVATFRHDSPALLEALAADPDLVIHSPGPGRPEDFAVPALVRRLADQHLPQFGICLGLQGMVEAFGGELAVFEHPRHGKYWQLHHNGGGLFEGLQSPARVGAYHSLYAVPEKIPAELDVIARNENGIPMAVRHRDEPLMAVQFHPESILSMDQRGGHRIIANALSLLLQDKERAS